MSNRRASMAFILVTLFLDILGIGIVIPVLPHLVTDMLGGNESLAASYYGAIAGSYALMQFLFAPVLGALSDRFGRRPVLLISLFGFGVNYLLTAVAPNVYWLFLARIVSGIMGASFTTVNAYIADISTPENRAQNFGLVGAAFGLGFIFGPALGGVLGNIGPRVPFYVSAGVVLLNWLYGLFVLPESLPKDHRRKFTLREGNPLGGLLRLKRFPSVQELAMAFVFVALAQRGLETVWVLYTQHRYGWNELQNGMSLALVGIMAAIVQGGLIRRVVPKWGEKRSVRIGLLVSALAFIAYGLAPTGASVIPIIVVGAIGGIAGPTIQGLVTGAVDPSQQGAVQGALTSLTSLSAILAPLLSTQLFRYFTSETAPLQLPGAPFFLGSAFMMGALFIAVHATRNRAA
ncbi:MAG: TCR/Tet family MFS transporter [Candidatus Eisenbacteria bacterium]